MSWDTADSFVTHQKSLDNLRQIRVEGMREFARQQKERIRVLNELLREYDDGRSKSFFCLATALMEIVDLKQVVFQIQEIRGQSKDTKQLAKLAKSIIEQKAKSKDVALVYRKEKA